MNGPELEETLDRAAAAGRMGLPSQKTLERVNSQIGKELEPVRPLPTNRQFGIAFLIAYLLMVGILVWNNGIYALRMIPVWQAITVMTSLAACAALLSFGLVLQMIPGHARQGASEYFPAGALTFLLVVFSVLLQTRTGNHFVADGMHCLKDGLRYSLPAAALLLLVLRRGAVLNPRLAGVTLGVLAGLVGTAVLELRCTNTNLFHVLAWHLGVSILGGVAGLLAGSAVDVWRRVSLR